MKKTKLMLGDNISSLKKLPDNSVDSIVSDAPYGLGKEQDMNVVLKDWLEKDYSEIKGAGFMGKIWDAYVPQPAFWKEAIRPLKPGGHVLCFFGSRTYDIGVMAMRLAGFEIRDTITWNFGSGFPKSHNVQKAILKDLEQELKDKYNIKEVIWK
jgi:site-specific DNA-methyltransferase (adenine-specific)